MAGADGADEIAVHATAVVIDSHALLILGRSRTGKSRTACKLIAASTARERIRLLGDDRILLRQTPRGLIARPHPRIAGFIEKRGLGIVAEAYVRHAPVAGVLMLWDLSARGVTIPLALQNFPCLADVYSDHASPKILSWWRDACTTQVAKSSRSVGRGAED